MEEAWLRRWQTAVSSLLNIQLFLLCSHSPADDPRWRRGHCGCCPPPCREPLTGKAPRHCHAAHVHTPDKNQRHKSHLWIYTFGDVSLIQTHAFRVSPCTFAGAGFHCEANKGRKVYPEIRQALTGQQWPPKISAGHSGQSRTSMCQMWCSFKEFKFNMFCPNMDQCWGTNSRSSPVLGRGAALRFPARGTCLWNEWGR